MALAYWVVAFFLTLRSLSLGYLLGSATFDATFFTYINYGVLTLAMALLLLSMWNVTAYELWTTLLLPVVWVTTVFVALAIVVIVQLNDGVFLKTTTQNNGTNSVATIHTGDWLLHQFPFVEMLVILLLLRPTLVIIFHNFWRQFSTAGKVAYTIYFHTAGLLVLSFYMINIDYSVNYPTSISSAAIWGLTIGLSLFVGFLLFGFLYISKPRPGKPYTPTLRQHVTWEH